MKERIKILIVGKGGKETAIAWKLLQSCRVERLWSTPGSTPGCDKATGIDPRDFDSVAEFVDDNDIDMVIVGDERLIVDGIADVLREKCRAHVIAPNKECARLEGSKEFAKEFMFDHSVPMPRFMPVTKETLGEGIGFLEYLTPPYVLKADGLAEGKGVVILDSLADAKDTLSEMLDGKFGESSSTVIIEEFLEGSECSVMLAVAGEDYLMLPVARDYKRKYQGGNGPNTAGMGAVSPAGFVSDEFLAKVEKRIIKPTLRGLKEENMDYSGFLYFGIIDVEGEPMIFEYNVRLGDPETEAVLPRIESDFVDILEGIAERNLQQVAPVVSGETCVAVVLATDDYPDESTSPRPVSILEKSDGCLVFEAGIESGSEGLLFASSGRVAVVCGMGHDSREALDKALEGAERIEFEGKYYRRDIGVKC